MYSTDGESSGNNDGDLLVILHSLVEYSSSSRASLNNMKPYTKAAMLSSFTFTTSHSPIPSVISIPAVPNWALQSVYVLCGVIFGIILITSAIICYKSFYYKR